MLTSCAANSRVNNNIAKMEVGYLKHPGASMAGKSWQPSHEPPRSKGNRHPSHCQHSGREGRERGGRRTAWTMSCHTMERKRTPPVRTPRYAMLRSTSMCNSDTCASVSTPLTSRGTQALFVVNSFKLHLTAFNNCIAKMEVGCLKHPGASTIGSQLLDEDCSHGWQILGTQP